MKIDEILDLMDQLLDHAKPIPFASHKVIIDGDRMRELINDMRMNKPEEIRRAKLIEFDCDRIMQEAHVNGERIVQEAEQRAKKTGCPADHYDGSKRTSYGNGDQSTGNIRGNQKRF